MARCIGQTAVVARLLGLLTFVLAGSAPVLAAEVGQVRLGDDYAQFFIGGSDYRPCEKECSSDTNCKSWSYITTTGQCRLKSSVVPARPNACCVSGVKEEVKTAVINPDERDCTKWTNEAVAANDGNLLSQCGLSGPLWSRSYSDLNAHCLDSSPRRRARDADERRQALDACQKVTGRTRSLACDHYGRMAVAEAQSNEAGRCGLAGPQWTATFNDHVRFCQTANPTQVSDQIAARERQLLECLSRGGGGGDQACQGYADQATSQFVQSVRGRCGSAFAGPQWTDDQAQHYRWCRAHSPAERDNQLRTRQAALAQCDDDRKHFKLIFKF